MLAPGIKSRPRLSGPAARSVRQAQPHRGGRRGRGRRARHAPSTRRRASLRARPFSICPAGSAGKDYEAKLERAFAVGFLGLPDAGDGHVPPQGRRLRPRPWARGSTRPAPSPSSAASCRKRLRCRHRSQIRHHRASRLGQAPRPVRALQGLHRGRHHQSGELRPLRTEPARARSLFAPPRRVPGRLHRCRGSRRGSSGGRDLQMSASTDIRVRVAEVEKVADGIKRLKLVAANGERAARLLRRRTYRRHHARRRPAAAQSLFADGHRPAIRRAIRSACCARRTRAAARPSSTTA